MYRLRTIALVAIVAACATPAYAHKPIANDGAHSDPAQAIVISDVSISQVVYHKVTAQFPQIWLTFEGTAGQALHLELGVPKKDAYAALRPALALVGPGLPPANLPFQIPLNYGAWVFDTAGVTPETFHEPFTGTDSYIYPSQDVTLPYTGKYYVVGYLPGAAEGKLWMAVGTEEQFSFSDVLNLPRIIKEVRRFHEVPTWFLGFWIHRAIEWICAIA